LENQKGIAAETKTPATMAAATAIFVLVRLMAVLILKTVVARENHELIETK
jgi:hypothetical protein